MAGALVVVVFALSGCGIDTDEVDLTSAAPTERERQGADERDEELAEDTDPAEDRANQDSTEPEASDEDDATDEDPADDPDPGDDSSGDDGEGVSAQVEAYCDAIDTYIEEYKAFMADPINGDSQRLIELSEELTDMAIEITMSNLSAQDAERMDECDQRFAEGITD